MYDFFNSKHDVKSQIELYNVKKKRKKKEDMPSL